MFRTVPLSIIRSFHCTHSNGICHTGWLTACEQDQDGSQQTCMTYTTAVCTVKTPDDGQRNCPKHVEFYSKNKFEKLVHLVGFIIRIYHDARSPKRQILQGQFACHCYLSPQTARHSNSISATSRILQKGTYCIHE